MNNRLQELAPNDIWLEIFSHVEAGIPQLASTCKFFNSLLDNEGFWKRRIAKEFSDIAIDKLKALLDENKSYKSIYKQLYIESIPKTFFALHAQGFSGDIGRMQYLLEKQTERNGIPLGNILKENTCYLSPIEASKERVSGLHTFILGFNLSKKDVTDFRSIQNIPLTELKQHIIEISIVLNSNQSSDAVKLLTFKVEDNKVIANDFSPGLGPRSLGAA